MSDLLLAKNQQESKRLHREAAQGKCRRIAKAAYTTDMHSPLPAIIQHHWMSLVTHMLPGAILSHRTAIELKPYNNSVYVTGRRRQNIHLPGLTIRSVEGNMELGTEPLIPDLKRSNHARRCLENLLPSRERQGSKRTLGSIAVEEELAKAMNQLGEDYVKALRQQAHPIAKALGFTAAYDQMDALIGTLLSTRADTGMLRTPFGKAVAKREPYDQQRITLLETLSLYLRQCNFVTRPLPYQISLWRHQSFFESYFSNFIEGTEFEIDEAEHIVFEGQDTSERYADSHDVIAVYELAHDFQEMMHTPKNAEEFLQLLTQRHAFILHSRSDKHPGMFKQKSNRAGNTVFVEPGNVQGTLSKGFDLYQLLPEGMPRALFIHYLIAITHPFDDGNGRLARIMMNAELVAVEQSKIIVPTVHRENYINGLRIASQRGQFQTFVKSLDLAQAYTVSINWMDYGEARATLETDAANQKPDDGLATFYRAVKSLPRSHMPKNNG